MNLDWGRPASFLRALWIEALDALLPPQARTMRTKNRTLAELPLAPRSHVLLGETVTALADYRKPEVQDLIRSLKYDGSDHAAHLCARILADYLREEIATIRTFSPRPVALVPLPLHPSRERERGFNQIALVLARLPEEMRDGTLSYLAPEILIRTRATPRQTLLQRRERIRNMKDAFAVPLPALARHAHVFIIDDVATTGATLAQAAKPLRKAGASVHLITLARA